MSEGDIVIFDWADVIKGGPAGDVQHKVRILNQYRRPVTRDLTPTEFYGLRDLIRNRLARAAQRSVQQQSAAGAAPNSASSARPSAPPKPFFTEPTERQHFRNIAHVYQFDVNPESPTDLTRCLTELQKELVPHLQRLLQEHRGIKLALVLNVVYEWSIPKIPYTPRFPAALRTGFEVLYPASSIPEYLEKVDFYNYK